jgi:hypothetical protein
VLGLVYMCSDGMRAIRSIVDALTMPHDEVRVRIHVFLFFYFLGNKKKMLNSLLLFYGVFIENRSRPRIRPLSL